jgi:hypothetical protein
MVLAKLAELKLELEKISTQCSPQYPPFTQVGYVPQSLLEFKELFLAKYVAMYTDGSIVEYEGSPEGWGTEDLVRSPGELTVSLLGEDFAYMVRHRNHQLILITRQYLDSVSLNLLREFFRKYIDEVRQA